MNDTQETTTQETTPPMTTELQDYNNQVLVRLENINNALTLDCFFLGAILGACLITLFWSRVRT